MFHYPKNSLKIFNCIFMEKHYFEILDRLFGTLTHLSQTLSLCFTPLSSPYCSFSIFLFFFFFLNLVFVGTQHPSCTSTLSAMLSNGPEAQVRTDLTAVGLVSRNTWWLPVLMPGLISEAWDSQQLLSGIKLMSHPHNAILFNMNKHVAVTVICYA